MPPKPNLKFRPTQNAPRAGVSPPLTSFNEEAFDEDVSLEAMALQLQRESGLTYRGGIDYGELDGHAKISAEALDDIRLYPKRAPQLPANTMPSLLTSETTHGAHGHVYAPIPLNHKDAMQPGGASRTSAAAKAGSTTSASTAAAVKAEEEDRGVAFLKERAEEDVRAWQANRQFHEQTLKPNVLASSSSTTAPLSSSSPRRNNDGDLVWLQMPRFYENPPFDLSTMEPGKVGELVVLKSGRILLRIHNVYYDVAASCEEEQLAGPSETPRPTPTSRKPLEGPCSMAVISTNTTPTTQFGNNERPSVSCYEVGLLTKKLVCTPTISESS